MKELIVDSFAGGGGASTGIEWALGRSPDIAINHDADALAMHQLNHPDTRHFCEDVWQVDPVEATGGRPVGLAWFSPDCTHHSKARGGKPRSQKIRGLAWVVIRWAKAVRPRVICLENVEEFATWGPLTKDGQPCPVRKGLTFRRWWRKLEALGYEVDARELRACDYGAPTTRKRLFIIARSDGQPIVWPEPTHGPGLAPYRTAAEIIDWTLPCPSIFGRRKPLADATLRRIARGVMRYVVNNPQPFIAPLTHHGERRVHPVDEPLPTVTGANRGEMALVSPYIVGLDHQSSPSAERPVGEPLTTITSKARHLLVAPALINTRNGEREGQKPRVRDIQEPYATVTAQGSQGAVVAAFLAKHYGGHENDGIPMTRPTDTVTARDHHSLVTSHVVKLRRNGYGQDVREPLETITAGGLHFGEVRAFLLKYYGTDQDPRLADPLHTITAKDRFGLVTVKGEQYQIADIGMRMLAPHELFRAQGFPEDVKLIGTKTTQVRLCGNSVCPPLAEAIVRANFAQEARMAA